MIKNIIKLIPALVTLTSGQFLLLPFSLAASICLRFLLQARYSICGFTMHVFATLVWGVSWVVMPNALVEWVFHQRTRLIIKGSNTLLLIINFLINPSPNQ